MTKTSMGSWGPLILLVCLTSAVLGRSILFDLNRQQLLAGIPNRDESKVVNHVQSLTLFTRTLLSDPLVF